MGFKTESQAEKVILIIHFITIITLLSIITLIRIICIIARYVKILDFADHVWQDKRAAIAKTVDDLGDQFRPAMRAGWLSYIRQAYPDNAAPAAGPPVRQGTLVLPD